MSDATNRIDVHWPAGTPQDDHQRGWNLGNMAGQQEGYERGCADERRRVLDELESRVRERQSYGSTALDGVLSDVDAMRQDGEQ